MIAPVRSPRVFDDPVFATSAGHIVSDDKHWVVCMCVHMCGVER